MTDEQSGAQVGQYIDARELLPEYERRLCPRSGEEEWTKPTNYKHSDHGPVCEPHSSYINETLEVPCPECGTRMLAPGHEDVWECSVCNLSIDRPTEKLVDRLTTDSHFQRGMAGVLMGECPVCGEENSVNGNPDGDLVCDECHDFYAGRFSAKWYAYAHWMAGEMDVRVNREGAI